ncbi:30S ribosomal protein S16 [uncultured Varibaculum sp.]|uniref:30S ribosomal protein S16 n=1 Tax=uncultured Varibaculum sp. TaxID=413896 RepID=UPI00288AE0A4|nr:30S ribosomal protein S16 [uncultured Varibaculum sp.]
MAVRIRLKRIGKIHYPVYRVVVVDSRKKRDGRVIEEVGQYNPNEEPSFIQVKSDRIQYWLGVGAQPSDAVRRLLVLSGDIARFNGKENVESWIKTKETLTADQAREKNVKAAADEAQKRKAKVSEEKAKAEAEAAAKEAEEAKAKEAEESAEAEEAAPESEEA